MLLAGLLLLAAAMPPDLPDGYWMAPHATTTNAPEGWPAMEMDLHPEACAQCHRAQFDAWRHSRHAAAFSPGLVGQFPRLGLDAANACLQCHAPLAEQRLRSHLELTDAVRMRAIKAPGFDPEGSWSGPTGKSLSHAGVTCAACHVRSWRRFGPPTRDGQTGFVETGVHGGFFATPAFEESAFCASCHQFPESMAVNGKPLENTLNEWKASAFSRQGITCQQCHMPDRWHAFAGIHDPAFVRRGLELRISEASRDRATLQLRARRIGHAFPTYVTPRVTVEIEVMDAQGNTVARQSWQILREVAYRDGWKELRDTRLMPGEKRTFFMQPLPAAANRVRFRVFIEPDAFYKGLYRRLLAGELAPPARRSLALALEQARKNDYVLFEAVRELE